MKYKIRSKSSAFAKFALPLFLAGVFAGGVHAQMMPAQPNPQMKAVLDQLATKKEAVAFVAADLSASFAK